MYEKTSIGVVNHYGPRSTGGTKGVLPSVGATSEYAVNFDGEKNIMNFKFPVGVVAYVTGIQTAGAKGTLGTATIGGVDIKAASEAAPVKLLATNTGEVVLTGLTGGTALIRYMKFMG